MIYNTNKISV